MEKELLEKFISDGLSIRDMVNLTNKSYSTLRHWIKKYNLKTKYRKTSNEVIDDKKICVVCDLNKEISEFYKSDKVIQPYCKKCSNLYHQNRIKEVKIKMIEYKGGECENCRVKLIDTHYCIFDFHHIDPKTKDVNFKRIKFQKWDKIKNEIDKCKLLCSNCHRLEHAKLNGWGNTKKIVENKNKKLEKYCNCGKKILITSSRCIECYNNQRE